MTRNSLFFLCLILFSTQSFSQDTESIKGIWQQVDLPENEPLYFSLYYGNNQVRVLRVEYPYDFEKDSLSLGSTSPSTYGFYDNDILPSIDSLKTKGWNYFEVTKEDFVDSLSIKLYRFLPA